MKSITHLFFDRRLRKYNACSSVPKCRTTVSINTFAKQNKWPWRKEGITRHLAMMNSRRGEPRALFITFYLINRTKSRRYREHHSSKGVHFEFHASKVHSYTYRVVFISLLLYSDLYCKKWLIFYGSSSCYNDNKIKMKEKKKERKNILPFGKIRSRETFRCTQGRYHKTTKAFSNVHSVKNFYLNKTDVIITVNTSHLIHRGLRFSPRGLGSSFLGLRLRNIGPLFVMKTDFVMIQPHLICFHFFPDHLD